MHPSLAALVNHHQGLLRQLITGLGSPLNVVQPDNLGSNIQSFRTVFDQWRLSGRIYFAHKATQSDAIVRQLAVTDGVDIDVASMGELEHALSCGIDSSRLQATGPKNKEFLMLCLLHDIIINIDNLEEIAQLIEVQELIPESRRRQARVLLRLRGFSESPLAKDSRFGISLHQLDQAFARLKRTEGRLRLLGFSFHLDTVGAKERAEAIVKCTSAINRSLDHGFRPNVIDIGGGFKTNYLANQEDWSRFVKALKEAVLGHRDPITWNNAGFGLYSEKGQLRGIFNSDGFFDNRPGALSLHDILNTSFPGSTQTIGEYLASNLIELWIEPGRATLDQSGFTLSTVKGVSSSSHGHSLVILDMKRTDVVFLDQEPFVDPVMVYSRPVDANSSATPVFLAGNLCSEADMICRRLVWLPQLPQTGDMVIFPNTAAYRMDFNSSRTMMQPVGQQVALCQRQDGDYVWFLDKQFSPVWRAHH
jgi:diaminopimelate decarboxylase